MITLWMVAVLPGTLFVKGETLHVEILTDEAERAVGLMYRDTLPERYGALFVFPYPQKLSFWMKNTFIPLDLAFLDRHGIITEIIPLQPLDETPVTSSQPVPFALEVPRGFFDRIGAHPGDTVSLPSWLIAPYSPDRLFR